MRTLVTLLATTALIAPASAWAQEAAEEETGGPEEIVVTA